MKKLFLLMFGVLLALPTFARDFDYTYAGKTLIYTVIDEDAKTCMPKQGYNNPGNYVSGNLILPSEVYDGDTQYTLTEIGSYAFYGCSGLTSVTIPNSVTKIGDDAFSGCTGLTSVTIPNSVKSIGSYAFTGCSGLTSVIIPDSVTEMGNSAFSNCSGLTSVSIGKSLTKIDDYTFYNCGNIESVYFDCDSLSSMFSYKPSLKTVTLGNNVKTIDNSAFCRCEGLTAIHIGNSVTEIGEDAFFGCESLTKAEFASIEHLCAIKFNYSESNPLKYAHNLYINGEEIKDLVIPESVTTIGNSTFCGCSGLTSVTIPNSVTEINYFAFSECSGLTKAEFASIEHLCAIKFDYLDSNPLYYAHNLYINGEEITEVVIPETVDTIGDYTFGGWSGLTSLTIPNSVTSIGNCAFTECTGLTEVFIPNSVTSIGWSAFSRCSGLKKSAYPSTVSNPFDSGYIISYSPIRTIIEDGWIYNITKTQILYAPLNLEGHFTIPEAVTIIGRYAFAECRGLTGLTIPNSVNSISESAFAGCSGITNIEVKKLVPPSVYESSFSGLYDSAEVTIPQESGDNYLYSSWGLFENLRFSGSEVQIGSANDGTLNYYLVPAVDDYDKNIAVVKSGNYSGELTIPGSITHIDSEGNNSLYHVRGIGYQAFKNSSVTKINIDSDTDFKVIGEEAFYRCTSLAEIPIPNSVKTIGVNSFNRCTKLAEITIPNSVETISNRAFRDCSGLTSVTIPNSVTEIGIDAFGRCDNLTEVIYLAEEPIECEWIFDDEIYQTATLHYLKSAEEKIASTEPWSLFVNRIGRDAGPESAIPEIRNIESAATKVYDMRGVKVGESTEGLPNGVYIIREGSKTTKHAI